MSMEKTTQVQVVDNDVAVTVERDYWDVLPEICNRISDGELLVNICKDNHIPYHRYLHEWFARCPEAYSTYVRARKVQGHHYFDKIVELATGMSDRNYMRVDRQIGALKWVTGRLNAQYSDNPTTIVDQSQHVHVQQLQDDQSEKSNRLLLAAKKRALPGA